MFDKIQMILMMKTSISNNRISRLNDDGFSWNKWWLGSQPAWDVFEISQTDLHWEKHLKDLSETSQKRRLFWDVFKTSQIHLKKDAFFVTSLRRLNYISKKMSFLWITDTPFGLKRFFSYIDNPDKFLA